MVMWSVFLVFGSFFFKNIDYIVFGVFEVIVVVAEIFRFVFRVGVRGCVVVIVVFRI